MPGPVRRWNYPIPICLGMFIIHKTSYACHVRMKNLDICISEKKKKHGKMRELILKCKRSD